MYGALAIPGVGFVRVVIMQDDLATVDMWVFIINRQASFGLFTRQTVSLCSLGVSFPPAPPFFFYFNGRQISAMCDWAVCDSRPSAGDRRRDIRAMQMQANAIGGRRHSLLFGRDEGSKEEKSAFRSAAAEV